MKYLKMSAFILLYLFVYLILQAYLSVAAGLFLSLMELIQNPFVNPSSITEPLLKGTIIIVIAAALISFIIYWFVLWLRKESIFRFCNFSKIGIRNIVLVSLLGVALVFPVSYVVELLRIDQLSKSTEEAFNFLFKENNVLILLLGVGIIGPIIEEIIFRGLILNELKRNINIVAAVFIQALLFGAYHLNLSQAIYAFPLGLILGLVYVKTRSIWGSILIHIFFNSTSVILSKIPGGEPQFLNNQISVVLSFVISIAALVLIFLYNRKNISFQN